MRISTFLSIILIASFAQAQQFLFTENFDRITAPALPAGWTTTTNRSATGDFITTKSTSYSDSNAVVSTNATISQLLLSPMLNFSGTEADSITFYERRSGTHNSGVIVEASTDGGSTFTIQLSDTLKNPGTTSYVLRKFKLPSTIDNQPNIKFRWRVLGNGTGTTGTIRFDNVTITARFQFDISVHTISFIPEFPNAGDSVHIIASIRNDGTQSAQNISVEFYEDANNDSLPDLNELFSSASVNQMLQPGDTMTATASISNMTAGQKTIILKSNLPGDQNTSNDIKRSMLSIGLVRYSIVINEIMYAPPTGEPEWVELFNPTSSDIDLNNWKISNRNSSPKYSITSNPFMLPSKDYCIITKDTTLFRTVHQHFSSNIIQSVSLPTFLFNNSGDAVVLYDARGAWMDSVHYYPSWGGTGGVSLEKIESGESSNDSTNWSPSGDSSGSTPGAQNYATPLEFDLSVLRVSAVHSGGSKATVSITVKNTGHQSINSFSILAFYDANEDSIPQPSELIQTQQVSPELTSKDSVKIDINWNNPPSGKVLLIGAIDFLQDMRTSDNIAYGSIKIAFMPRSMIVNEIMYEPHTGQSEYVELYNRSAEPIEVRDWRISDVRDTSSRSTLHLISKTSMRIGAGEFLVIGTDSSLYQQYTYLADSSYHVIIKKSGFNLNNDGDDILLTDLTGEAIDSIHYFSFWHNADIEQVSGRALERINPNLPSNDRRNWSTSANPMGGTPGKQNSLYTIAVPTAATLSFSPNPFSPDGDGFEDVSMISYKLPATAVIIRIRIYDVQGRLVRKLADSEPSGANGEIIWDGFNDNRERVRIGIYVVLLEALDGNGGNMQTVKGVVVVAAKM